ncbi:MAG: DnaA ATPase domain-containing protein, partial [Mycoplasmatales bacterium]
MAELFVWDRIIKIFEEKHGSDISGFLFENSKLLKLEKNEIIIKLDPLSLSLLEDKNGDLFISLKKSIDNLLRDDIHVKLVTNSSQIQEKMLENVGEKYLDISKWNYEDTCLNPSFTFENYFYSYDNRKAIDAANQVIKKIINQNDEVSYNPFFIHGASGIGKTHFVNAIGNEIFSQNPNLKLLCKNATEFFNEYTRLFKGSLNTKKLDDFKEQYFNLDVFIIDDIQMLSTKEGSLNEFFSIFESMRLKNNYLIITCDVRPRDLSFEERLLTRFLSGLVLEIHFPDSDTKTQIFKYHAHKSELVIDEAAIQIFINSSENVRELLGYINSIKIDMITNNLDTFEFKEEDAIEVVNKTTGIYKKLTKKEIMEIISSYFDITMQELTSKNRAPKNVIARNFCVFFLKDKLKMTFVEIAIALGMKDHSNAVKIYKKFEEFKNKN